MVKKEGIVRGKNDLRLNQHKPMVQYVNRNGYHVGGTCDITTSIQFVVWLAVPSNMLQ